MSSKRPGVGEPWRLVAAASAARVFSALMALLTAALTARYLGAAGRGSLVAATGWVTMFATLGHLSLGQVALFLATGRTNDRWLPPVAGTLLLMVAGLSLLGLATAGALFWASSGTLFAHVPPASLLLAFLALPALLWIEHGGRVLMAAGALNALTIGQVAAAAATPILTVLAVAVLDLGREGAVAAFTASQALLAALVAIRVGQRAGHLVFDRQVGRALLAGGLKLHANAVGVALSMQTTTLIVNHFGTSEETAWFQLATQVVTVLHLVPTAAASVTYAHVARDGPDGAWPQQRSLLAGSLLVMVAVATILAIAAPSLVPAIFGSDFRPAVAVMRILLLSVVGLTVSQVMASQWIGRGLFVQASLVTLSTGVVSLLITYLVVPRYGIAGAAWVSVATSTIGIVVNGIMALRIQRRTERVA